MAGRYVLGGALVTLGALMIVSHRALGVLQARLQPRFMHPWTDAAKGSRAILFIIGIGLLVSGIFEIIGRWGG